MMRSSRLAPLLPVHLAKVSLTFTASDVSDLDIELKEMSPTWGNSTPCAEPQTRSELWSTSIFAHNTPPIPT
ncbi:hypothetical protein HD806DRAFT_521539 [Xylariaceae sp. AK1471]|nr:hypothetical protein HD806DRAFT_521539 [Xylariaceae sp. AK1471]